MAETIKIIGEKEIPYDELLDSTQNYIKDNYSSEAVGLLKSSDAEKQMKEIISCSLVNLSFFSPSDSRLSDFTSRIYWDMSGMSFLSKYLNHLDDDYKDLTEINGNKWNSIVLKYTDGRTEFTKESFASPEDSINHINKIISKHDKHLDKATPEVTSDITNNIRITAKIYPTIPEDYGADFTIRITRPHSITHQKLIESGTVSSEIMDFLQVCVKYGLSMCVSGKQYAGKTTLINYLLSLIPNDLRIYLIEEGSRELSLAKFDKDGRMINQVIPCLTRPSSMEEQNYDTERELQFGLRYDSDVIVPQEMRGGEAFTAVESANTGSMVVTTIHANSATSTYLRILTLMQLNTSLSESMLMRLAVDAFPIIIHMARPSKNSLPRVMEVYEGERYDHEKGLIGRTLYRYVVEDSIEKNGIVMEVKGHFEKVNGISERLQRILLNNCAPKKLVDFYAEG